jgi:molybdopterin-containing oxidoreductase family iron-sulfur binding subunit
LSHKINRRQFLKLVGTTGALAASGACEKGPVERLIPFVIPPEDVVPGIPVWYSTVCGECPAGCGMRVRTREGRAVKLEGIADHPVNRGALCARGQASLQGLYNPDRPREPLLRKGEIEEAVSWDDALKQVADIIMDENRSGDVVLLTGKQGPSVNDLMEMWMDSVKGVRWLQYEPFQNESLKKAGQIVFDTPKIPLYRFGEAEYILSLGADFLGTWNSPVEHSKEYAEFRAKSSGKLVQVESRRSLTGANADEWLKVKPGTEVLIVLTLINVMLERGWHTSLEASELDRLRNIVRPFTPAELHEHSGPGVEKIYEMAREFSGARPGIAVSGGEFSGGMNSTLLDTAVLLLNYAAGYIGRTVVYTDGDRVPLASYRDLAELTDEMKDGNVDTLIVSGLNPAFFLPDSTGFVEALENVKTLIAHHDHDNETAFMSDLVLPSSHFLECWGDWSGEQGHFAVQPVMNSLYDTKSFGDLIVALDRLTGNARQTDSFPSYLKSEWKKQYAENAEGDFDAFWEEMLRRGGVISEPVAREVQLSSSLENDIPEYSAGDPAETKGRGLYQMVLYPSIFRYDGRGANKPWLQETPDPLTQIVWDSWVELSEEEAAGMGIEEGSMVSLTSKNGSVELPAHIYEGISEGIVGVPFGQGHSRFGRYGSGVGEKIQKLLSGEPEPHSGALILSPTVVRIEPVGVAQGRGLVSVQGGLFEKNRGILGPKGHGKHRDMYPAHPHPEYRWAMAVDLKLCTGCGACVVACYAENNISCVGKQEVAKGREMAWLRIEKYLDENHGVNFIPMMCQHCDYAPCEPVCPVHATYHNPEGLNAQVYNRCVGTRYCANNCPYKVRRFNWFTYTLPESLSWQLNPDISVREKGVMEKCTFCLQRIREAEDGAKDEDRLVRDGEVITACAQTCPTGAIVFGNLKDPESEVAKLASSGRSYRVLETLNTKPAVYYLEKKKKHT